MKILNFFPKGPTTFKIWEMNFCLFADHDNAKKYPFDWLAAKL